MNPCSPGTSCGPWLSTPGHGLALFREGRFRSFNTRDGLSDNEVTALCESPGGGLWAGLGDSKRGLGGTDRARHW